MGVVIVSPWRSQLTCPGDMRNVRLTRKSKAGSLGVNYAHLFWPSVIEKSLKLSTIRVMEPKKGVY